MLKKGILFTNLPRNIKFQVFSKFKFTSPRIMVNKCVVTNSLACYKTGQKKASFYFPQDHELRQKWSNHGLNVHILR